MVIKTDFETKPWLTASISLLLTEIVLSVVVQIDMLLLEVIGPVESDVGVFGALLTLCAFIWVILCYSILLHANDIRIVI